MVFKPGIIAVRSRPSSPLLTPIVFQKWYEDVHIPDVLGTGHVKSATRYHVTDAEDRDEGSMPFLAIYNLPDMGWLHEEGCQFWKIPLHSEILPGDNTSIFDVAEFATSFYEIVDTAQLGMATDGRGVASRMLLSSFNLTQEEQGGDPSSIHKVALARLGIKDKGALGSVRSTLFKVDQTRPHHPAMQTPVGTPGEKQYLCMVRNMVLFVDYVSRTNYNLSWNIQGS
ncbi:hypothetical protein B0T21DRAFT_300425 [Apiosordaria backusii]|uniref:Uncharacterized protein n=1 Tax=Apiosordaria backusii TaxID=314023 RepID=A0AA39ZPX7_9PEZI|nr:hypothetical protein B0T21DRAFT_300425 [Apiosordaria backusii]